jgi:hypothetical protein
VSVERLWAGAPRWIGWITVQPGWFSTLQKIFSIGSVVRIAVNVFTYGSATAVWCTLNQHTPLSLLIFLCKGSLMASTLELIRDWATTLPYWEQAALELIAAQHQFTESDYQRLLDLCMEDGGLMPKTQRPPLFASCILQRIRCGISGWA